MTRSRLIPATLVALLMALPATAQFIGPSASGRGAPINTVAQAAEARSDSRVVLEGHVIAHQFDDCFTFKDATGTMTVEIDRRTFRGQEVTPETKVRLQGEVERSKRGRYIDVRRLELI